MGGSAGGDARPPSFAPGDVRQLRSEVRQRLAEAQALRQELQRQGVDTSELDDVISGLRELDKAQTYDVPLDVARLQAAVVDGAKQFEYRLRRELAGTDEQRLLLSGTDEVPDGFRKLVEEYYKALSRGKKN
jgi:hypothetical protein